MINRRDLAGFLVCAALIVCGVLGIMTQSAWADVCAAVNKNGLREFSVPRNGVCLLLRQERPGEKFLDYRLSQPPKLGQFGTANLHDFAYQAGDAAGDDYFEYISINTLNGVRKEFRVRNFVHILP